MKGGLYSLTKLEIQFLSDNCNFTDEEKEILKHISYGRCDNSISYRMSLSQSTITRRKKALKLKILDFLKEVDLLTIYVNGEKKELRELNEVEIDYSKIAKIIERKLTDGKDK